MKTRGGLLVLASIAGLLSSATAQPPPPPLRNPDNLNNPQNLNNPIYQSNPQDLGPTGGPPLYGAPRPDTRPDPNPRLRIKRPADCPYGYRPGGEHRLQMPHLVICVVKPPYEPEYVDTPIGLPVSGGGGGSVQQTNPTALERTIANQCLGHPTGSYACGRGATECCGPNQDNMCFAGAYACYATGARNGPKQACCMSK